MNWIHEIHLFELQFQMNVNDPRAYTKSNLHENDIKTQI